MFKNNDSSISQKIDGNDNQQAVNISNTNIYQASNVRNIQSNMAKLLQGISEMVDNVEPMLPDTIAFDLLKKVEYNQITLYKDHFDFYVENKSLVDSKLKILVEYGDIQCREKIVRYVRNKWANIQNTGTADDRINALVKVLEIDLKQHSDLNVEDISHIPHVVFYVFSECKIFDKPPC